ncbi:MAG: FHA domain-containing protein [Cyanobacteriota bacterium]|nr:FHA domain-containing protein [Cyanobacteriota bacterium]
MITLTLMHPTQSVSVQSWTFESEAVIRIGRANDNDIVIYSAVVSRHHVELWKDPSGWEIINFGANGTYVNDEPIVQVAVKDGMILRLGNSGPKLQVTIAADDGKVDEKTPDSKRSLAAKIDAMPDEDTLITRSSKWLSQENSDRSQEDVTMFDFEQ